ncbi:MAG: endonuclease/exonuclease/phosphatase family protein [Nanoarchaeota archaeon]|nr:endonuclease/exonuclease/phosphatase family protein [Nanoarchaeota archaeon]
MAKNKLRVMSWNIGQFYTPHFSLANYLPFLNQGVLPAKYMPLVASTIKMMSPHVVCLQEIRDQKYNPEKICQLNRLEEELKKKYKGYYGPYSLGGERRALLIKRKYTVDKRFRIEELNLNKKEGVAIAAYIPQKKTWVANVHFEHYDFDLRQRQLKKVLDWLNEKKENIILAGDYNMRRTFRFTERYQQQIDDFFSSLMKKHHMRDASKNLGKTYFLKGINLQLDYFFTNLPKKQKEKTFVLKDKRWRMMDHYPIVGDFFVTQSAVLRDAFKPDFLKRRIVPR